MGVFEHAPIWLQSSANVPDSVMRYLGYNPGLQYLVSDEKTYYLKWLNDYYGRIKKYQGTPYYDLLMNNPYIGFQESGQNYGSDGFVSFWNDRFNNANLELSKILSSKFENDYNDPANQLAREKAAGLNSDISGQLQSVQSASAAPDEVTPTPGVDPSIAAQNQILEDQNRYNRVVGSIGTALNFVSNVFSFFGIAGQLAKVGSDIIVNSAVAAAKKNEAEETQKKVEALQFENNKAALEHYTNAVAGGLPANASEPVSDFGSILDSVPVSGYSPEQQQYIQQMRDSGYFMDSSGNPTAAVMDAYNKRLSSIAQGASTYAKNSALVGGAVDNLTEGTLYYLDQYGYLEWQSLNYRNQIQEIQVRQEALQEDILDYMKQKGLYEANEAEATARNASTMADYNKLLFGQDAAQRDKNVADEAAEYQRNLIKMQNMQADMIMLRQNALKQSMEGVGFKKYPFFRFLALDMLGKSSDMLSETIQASSTAIIQANANTRAMKAAGLIK